MGQLTDADWATKMLQLTPQQVRQVAVFAQRLGEKLPPATIERMFDVLQSIRCLQLDPIRAVERTQYTVLWSRLGNYDREWLGRLAYRQRRLFEYWAHAASLVLTEDYPIHQTMMNEYASDSTRKVAKWVAKNQKFKRYILSELEQNGERLSGDFEDLATVPWGSSGWTTPSRSLPHMLEHLWTAGEILVSKRDGLKRWWDLAERVQPENARTATLTRDAVTLQAAELALKSLGVGRVRDINNHFTRKRYLGLKKLVPKLIENGTFVEARVRTFKDEPWYLHKDFAAFVQDPKKHGWYPRTTLLSPFDNLICDRERTEQIWGFSYRIEIYVPEKKRKYGYYVLPILHGEQLIGRVDSRMERKTQTYHVSAVYVEKGGPSNQAVGKEVHKALVELGRFLGATEIKYGRKKPAKWRSLLRSQEI